MLAIKVEGFMRWVMDTYHWILEVVRRSVNTKGFVLLPKRWDVERVRFVA
ncbi:hypothetical protein [Nostoc sp.]